MGIEDLRTKADLERFLDEYVSNLPTTAVRGLPEALASRYAEQFPQSGGNKELAEAHAPLKGTDFTAPANMTVLAIGQFDLTGPSIGAIAVNAAVLDPAAIHLSASRFVNSTHKPLILKKDDVVQLYARNFGGAATAAEVHTALTIVRLS